MKAAVVVLYGTIIATATTSAAGTYSVLELVVGTYTVVATKYGYHSQTKSASIEPASGTAVNFALIPLSSIWGKVFYLPPPHRPDPPIAGALVEVMETGTVIASSYTDCQGRYKINNLYSGSYTVKASKEDFIPRTKEIKLAKYRSLRVDFSTYTG
jgi:hypothetical protein